MMQTLFKHPKFQDVSIEKMADASIRIADLLIERLKGE